jgi:hypothetical protein
MPIEPTDDLSLQEKAFVAKQVARYGSRLSGEPLWRVLGFGTERSFQRAAQAKRLPVQLYPVPVGKGRYALTTEVAKFLWKQKQKGGDGAMS